MSVQAMAWALEQQVVIDPTARHVLLVLANYAGKTGRSAYPSVGTLARESGLSERTVQTKLKQLVLLGIISFGNQEIAAVDLNGRPRHPGYRVNVYDLNLGMKSRGEGAAPLSGESDGTERVNLTDAAGVNLMQSRGEGAAPDPRAKASKSFEAPSKGLSVNAQEVGALARTIDFESVDVPSELGLDPKTVEDFIAHRLEIERIKGLPLTTMGWQEVVQKLKVLWEQGADVNEALKVAMAMGYGMPVDPSRGKDAVAARRQRALQEDADRSVDWALRNQPSSSPDREGAWNSH